MEKKYYLPINSTSLAHYFGCACIKPGKYFNNKQKDLQDKFNDFLLVTTHLGTQQTDCCLELIFTKQETADLIDIKDGFYLYEKPLPITRVKKIFFTSKERKEQTITNINMSTAFVPDELVEIIKQFNNIQPDKVEKPQDIHIISYENQIQTFNNLLGGFALLKNAGEDYMNYSENYFASLSTYLNLENMFRKTGGQFNNLFDDALYKKIKPFLRNKIDENILTNEAQKEGQKITKNMGIINLLSLQGVPYILAVLNMYGVGEEGKRKKIDDLILSNFHSQEIKSDLSEIIALCYGLNRGYAAFTNSYRVNNKIKEVKFRLNSQLDYYTIESLYQYSFNNPQEKSINYSYLDWCPRYKNTIKVNKTNYQILDIIVVGKKKAKVLSKEYWANILPFFLQSNKFSEKTLPQIYQELGEVVFNDTKKEIADDYENQIAQKQEEIDNLKAEQKKMLQETQKSVITKEYKLQEEQSISTIVKPRTPYLPKQDIDVKNIVEQTLKYKEKNQTMLKNEAKEKGIAISKGMKQDDIIVLLMTTKNNNLFGNE